MIDKRPAGAGDRTELGYWEDLAVLGLQGSRAVGHDERGDDRRPQCVRRPAAVGRVARGGSALVVVRFLVPSRRGHGCHGK